MSETYEALYYSHNCGRPYQRDEEWLRFFGSVAERIVRDIGPRTALDAGCAMGFLVETLRARGVDAWGIDISTYAVGKAHPDVRPFCRVGSIVEPFPQRYGLIVCIEVLEHLSPPEADAAIENFCLHADDVLFSSTPFDYKEVTHLNVRPPDYWAQRFAQHGFFRDVDFDASFITPWAVRFRKTHEPAWRVVYGYERRLWQLEQEVRARRELTVEQQGQLIELNRRVEELKERAAEGEEKVKALSAEVAAHLETVTSLTADRESLTAELESERVRSRELLDEKARELRDMAPLTAQYEQLAAQLAAQTRQLAAQSEQFSSLLEPVVSKQGLLEASLSQLAESRGVVEGLLAQAAEKEKIIAELVAQVADGERAAGAMRAELSGLRERAQGLERQLSEAEDAAGAQAEAAAAAAAAGERALRALSAELAARDEAIRSYKSRESGAELTIASLSRRSQEYEQSLDRLTALLAERDARLADVDSSMAWYLYNRIKYRYLHFLFRLYERIKKGYLISAYKRLGLAASWTPAARLSLTGSVAPLAPPAEGEGASPTQTAFHVAEVTPPPPLAPHAASADVIVCVHNALEDVRRCLESVVSHTRVPYRLILVDDGSGDETRDYLAAFAESQGAVLIRNAAAKGYTFAANQGLRRSDADYAVLLNSDTLVTPLWLDRMIACAESDPQVGLVGPLSNGASWQSIPEIFPESDWAENALPEGLKAADMAKLVARYSARLYPRIPFLNGFCLMIKRGVIERLGHFDEEVFGQGYGEENDYCLRARKAGFQLSVADDAYVYHAQSRSYSHERRKELTGRADAALSGKHEPQMIWDGVEKCRYDRVLEGVRARSRVMSERERVVEEGRASWEGARVAFILTIGSACGGGNVVFDEAEAMRRMGVDARIINLSRNRETFGQDYRGSGVPVVYADDEAGVAELAAGYDAVLATAYDTVYWLKDMPGGAGRTVRAYYVQDFEPYFFSPGSHESHVALASYTACPDLVRVTKTEWNREEVRRNTGADCVVVGTSLNIDLNRPRLRRDPDWPVRPLRVAAMIRPSTPRRNPRLTMEVLRDFQRARGDTVEIILFGCDSNDPQFKALAVDFAWRNAGVLTREHVASLLNEVDVFADFSEFQAMGLTALEAMACGAAVIAPRRGGAGSFARHGENALLVDTGSRAACLSALESVALDQKLRTGLQRQALLDACRHYPERAAYNILNAILPTSRP